MQADAPPLVDVRDIIRLVGQSAFERGRIYAKSGAVTEIEWDPLSGLLSSTVAGSVESVYRCHIELAPARDGYHKPTSANCSCFVGSDCKHVAATLSQCNAAHLQKFGHGTIQKASDLSSTAAASSTPVTVAPPDWKTTLGATTSPDEGLGTGVSTLFDRSVASPIALQFELREQTPRNRDRWRGPTAQTASAWQTGSTYRLGVRPAIRSNAGNWVRGNITWNTLGYQTHRLSLDAEHQRWFSQFVALYRATTRDVYVGQDTDWIYLDEFHSPLLWQLLTEASALGIELIGPKKDGTVTVGAEARLTLDVSARSIEAEGVPGESSGDLLLRTVLEIDGDQHRPENASGIGTHGIYTAVFTPAQHITMAPTPSPLSPEQSRLLSRSAILEIPASDAPEFLNEYYPRLRRTVEVTATDATVHLPEIVPPVLVVTAAFRAKQSLRLEWTWEYTLSAKIVRVPLHPVAAGAMASWNESDVTNDLRDTAVERATLANVTRVLDSAPVTATLQGLGAAEFSDKTIPRLRELTGVRVDIVGTQPDYRELTDIPKLVITTVETDKRDWFDLGVVVSIDGHKVPFGPLFKALTKGQKKLLLIDNSYLSLDQPVFDDLKRLIDEASSLAEWETGPRISRYQASLWAEFEELADETEQAQSWRNSVSTLARIESVEPTPLPHSLAASLRPYQRDGYNWLTFLWRHGLGGVLADDMGLGKTLQTLALVAHAVEQRAIDTPDAAPAAPFLVVAPTSVVSNWVAEAARFVPNLVVRGVTATEAKSGTPLEVTAAGADIVITSYALFRLNFESYQAAGWSGLILDEAQFVKNASSRAHRCAVELETPFKLAITGTPMENSLEDLWSLFSITAPGLFPSARRFNDEYIKPITGETTTRKSPAPSFDGALEQSALGARPKTGVRFTSDDSDDDRESDTAPRRIVRPGNVATVSEPLETTTLSSAELLAKLRRRIRPLMMRRTKELVATELPAKQEQVLHIDLAPRHRTLYDAYLQKERQKLLGLIDDLDKNRFIVFRSLTLLRMLSLDASLVDEEHVDVPSSKLDALFEQLEDVIAEGHRALIFSQFTSFLQKAAARLDAAGIDYAYLDGGTRKRSDVIDGFKKGSAPVFLISLKAGGFGLNLTEADYVFLLDPWWNPATETQAVDRTHRIGQSKNVMVYRLVARGTIEEKVMALKEKKAQLFSAVMDDDAVFSSALTADDIRGLLET